MARKPTMKALDKAREDFAAKFAKNYGDGVLDRSGHKKSSYEVISTGSLSVDLGLGIGGYVEGRITEVYGVDGVGKTTFVLAGIREAQRKHPDRLVAWIDMEGTFDRAWAVIHGVDVSKSALWIVTPESAEEVADQVKDCLRSGLFSMVVVDSIGAMIPEVEKDKDADEAVVAAQAKIITRMVKIAAVEARKTSTAVILINQVRANISAFGKSTTTGGGFALRHCSTHKIELKLGGERFVVQMDGERRIVGHPVAAMIERNKVAPPHRRAEFNLFHTPSPKYGDPGVDKADDAATVGIKTGVIATAGAWYTLPNGERVNGRPKVVDALRQDPALIDQVREAFLDQTVDAIDSTVDEADLDDVEAEVSQDETPVEDGNGGSKFGSLSSMGTGIYDEASQ